MQQPITPAANGEKNEPLKLVPPFLSDAERLGAEDVRRWEVKGRKVFLGTTSASARQEQPGRPRAECARGSESRACRSGDSEVERSRLTRFTQLQQAGGCGSAGGLVDQRAETENGVGFVR